MALFGRRRAKKQEEQFDKAMRREEQRQVDVRRDQMRQDVEQTREGGGIMEGANISLGYDDEEEEDQLLSSLTGLIV